MTLVTEIYQSLAKPIQQIVKKDWSRDFYGRKYYTIHAKNEKAAELTQLILQNAYLVKKERFNKVVGINVSGNEVRLTFNDNSLITEEGLENVRILKKGFLNYLKVLKTGWDFCQEEDIEELFVCRPLTRDLSNDELVIVKKTFSEVTFLDLKILELFISIQKYSIDQTQYSQNDVYLLGHPKTICIMLNQFHYIPHTYFAHGIKKLLCAFCKLPAKKDRRGRWYLEAKFQTIEEVCLFQAALKNAITYSKNPDLADKLRRGIEEDATNLFFVFSKEEEKAVKWQIRALGEDAQNYLKQIQKDWKISPTATPQKIEDRPGTQKFKLEKLTVFEKNLPSEDEAVFLSYLIKVHQLPLDIAYDESLKKVYIVGKEASIRSMLKKLINSSPPPLFEIVAAIVGQHFQKDSLILPEEVLERIPFKV